MERDQCHCPSGLLQQLAADLSHSKLAFDKTLHIGSELTSHLETIANCNRCVTAKRKINMLSQTTSRLVGFYEAAHLNTHAFWTDERMESPGCRLSSKAGATPSAPGAPDRGHRNGSSTITQTPDYRSVSCAMRLGSLPVVGGEARILGEVVLVDACLELHERMQEWKMAMDESMQCLEEQYDALICHSLDRLAKLIGLLQYDGHNGEHWR
ncbi:hypothetical protein NOR_05360 [Metarhizium rileyi]|uniref:Uncharacterized protein n=1 Tax=Metarhizium rileyi (strain RCEF 4871) TaxID=1649241 RepID=A0A167CJZ8_METRR|nr:hypothetical protein NOR_05360 [Metarhizium rileyi RCEF 4871]